MWIVWIYICILCVNKSHAQYGTYKYNLLNRPTNQSSTYSGSNYLGTSDKAVDEDPGNVFEEGSCTHTEKDNPAWWVVDMQDIVTVHSVTIRNRLSGCCHNRLNQFSIFGVDAPYYNSGTEKQECFKFNGIFGDGIERTINCHSPVMTRFLAIAVIDKEQFLTLCDVQVTAECADGMFGVNCAGTCSPHCKMPLCDKFSQYGTCLDGECMDGYDGLNCTEECQLGKYGPNCVNDCPVNCKDQCSAVTGKCNGGCNDGYTGDTCKTECSRGTFGQNCAEHCYCKEGTCDHVTGLNCTQGCAEGYTGETCSETTTGISDREKHTSSGTSASMLPVIIGVVIGILVLVVVAGAVFIVLRRRKRKSPRNGEVVTFENNAFNGQAKVVNKLDNKPLHAPRPPGKPAKTHSSSTQELFDESTLSLSTPDETSVYANVQDGRSKTKVGLKDIGTLLQNMSVQKRPFLDEYEDIPKKTSTWDEAGIDALKAKNRYINILPYDNNRVKLRLVGEDPLSSYINASFIKDYDGQVSYIASLGPTEKTLEDTWRMIWEQGISTIIMVTNLMEESKTKCVRYWPTGQTAKFGDITVSTEREEHRAHLVKRVIKASMHKQSKIVTHYHYKAWPDKRVPSNLSSLLQLRQIVKTLRTEKKVPILVHCSAGIGRTGTFIAFDILMDQADKEGAIDVYQCVTKLREQRTQLVQTLEQYVFLYTVFHEMTSVGTTLIPAEGIHKYTKSPTFEVESSKQFSYLQNTKPTIPKEDLLFGLEDNPDKNRDQNVIAGDDPRVILLSDPDSYINAVYVSDYEWARAYCVTQLPLQHTVVDFWRMVFELKSSAVVCLETDKTDTWQFIPQDDSPLLCDNMCITSKQSQTDLGLTTRKVEVSNNMMYANLPVKTESEDVHEVDLYEFKNWTATPLLKRDLTPVQHVLRQVSQLSDRTSKKPLTVMCRNGASESGLLVALLILMENLKSEHEIDVYQVVKLIRKSRPQFITSQEQYNWLYQTIERIAHHK